MKKFGAFVVSAFVGGLLIVAPLYLAALLLLKAMHSVVAVVRPSAPRQGEPSGSASKPRFSTDCPATHSCGV